MRPLKSYWLQASHLALSDEGGCGEVDMQCRTRSVSLVLLLHKHEKAAAGMVGLAGMPASYNSTRPLTSRPFVDLMKPFNEAECRCMTDYSWLLTR